jgi:hypothetical protein
MSRLDGEDPRRDRFFEPVEPPAQPESTADGTGFIGSSEWFATTDEMQKRAAAEESGQPLSGALALNFAAPRQSRYVDPPQPGSLQAIEIEAERLRYRSEINGGDPTPEQIARHESRLAELRA